MIPRSTPVLGSAATAAPIVKALATAPGTPWVVAGWDDGQVAVMDPAFQREYTLNPPADLPGDAGRSVLSITFDLVGEHFAVAFGDRVVGYLAGQPTVKWEFYPRRFFALWRATPLAVVATPVGFVVSMSTGQMVRLDAESGEVLAERHDDESPHSCALLADGTVYGTDGWHLQQWDPFTLNQLAAHDSIGRQYHLATDRAGRWLAIREEMNLNVYDAALQPVREIPVQAGPPILAVLSDGIVSAHDELLVKTPWQGTPLRVQLPGPASTLHAGAQDSVWVGLRSGQLMKFSADAWLPSL